MAKIYKEVASEVVVLSLDMTVIDYFQKLGEMYNVPYKALINECLKQYVKCNNKK